MPPSSKLSKISPVFRQTCPVHDSHVQGCLFQRESSATIQPPGDAHGPDTRHTGTCFQAERKGDDRQNGNPRRPDDFRCRGLHHFRQSKHPFGRGHTQRSRRCRNSLVCGHRQRHHGPLGQFPCGGGPRHGVERLLRLLRLRRPRPALDCGPRCGVLLRHRLPAADAYAYPPTAH